ncbi:KilA-N domain-containing protein [Chromobacterium haemolyticum]|uniref:KilA-N domain-containing protein n=1 Tax=Chromobacterium haemolyticum TaxID=394935 RepID=UPI0012DF98C4|nr:KilA-N domain-containing protein [Chromobacterium haemolyticum]
MAFEFREDGYFNMTKAAKAYGKDVREFLKNASTTEYAWALSDAGISPHLPTIQTKHGYHMGEGGDSQS